MRSRFRPSHGTVVAYLALFVALGGTTYAATGGKFILGQSNTASSKSTLSAPVADKALTVTNNSNQGGATALGLNVAKGHPPFRVNSGAKVANLNADRLDGIDLTQLPAVHLGTAPQTSGGTVIQWHALGARFRTSGSADNNVVIENIGSQDINVRWGSQGGSVPPGITATVNVLNVTPFLVWSADGIRGWSVVCARTIESGSASIRCEGTANEFSG